MTVCPICGSTWPWGREFPDEWHYPGHSCSKPPAGWEDLKDLYPKETHVEQKREGLTETTTGQGTVLVQRDSSTDYTIKDSGKRETLAGGMVRDTTEGKVDYTLVLDGPMFDRNAQHLTKGAKKYAARNWMKCAQGTPEERKLTQDRFLQSALRHFLQWTRGDRDEDHAAAVYFNINGYEYLRDIAIKNGEV